MLSWLHLEELGHVEEHRAFFQICEVLALVEKVDNFVEHVCAFAVLEFLLVEDFRFLNKVALVQV